METVHPFLNLTIMSVILSKPYSSELNTSYFGSMAQAERLAFIMQYP